MDEKDRRWHVLTLYSKFIFNYTNTHTEGMKQKGLIAVSGGGENKEGETGLHAEYPRANLRKPNHTYV